ncbi:MAG: hypothetical protein ABIQ95_04535 [Bdellovibrionia bacterium]
MKANKKRISSKEIDEKFESGKDIAEHVDWDAATKAVNVDLPVWAVKGLDREATRRGVARQALIKMWLIDRLDSLNESKAS